jgi:hypothetical protein
LGVEAPKSTPGRSPMPLLSSPSFFSLPTASPPPAPPASLPDLGRGGTPESTPRRSPMPLLSPSPFPLLTPLALPSPTASLPGPWAWRLLRSPRLGEAPCLFSPPPPPPSPFSPTSPTLASASPTPPRLAPRPWAWRLLRIHT